MADEAEPGDECGADPLPASYLSTEGAAGFAAADRATDWLLGHSFVFAELRLAERPGATLLDFGCGPGEVADHVAHRYRTRVIGVDESPAMLRTARRRGTPGATYHLARTGRVPSLPDACADMAMCAFVLTCLPEPDAHRQLLSEMRRLLRPGGRLALLTVNPAAYGVQFTSVRVGEPGVHYAPGDPLVGSGAPRARRTTAARSRTTTGPSSTTRDCSHVRGTPPSPNTTRPWNKPPPWPTPPSSTRTPGQRNAHILH
jgi:SAM-dependent methyltransferase